MRVNRDITERLVKSLEQTSNLVPILFSSSIQAEKNNDYGASKLAGERVLEAYSQRTGSPTYIYRLPNVFGKWSRPHYNSAVATFAVTPQLVSKYTSRPSGESYFMLHR